MPRARGMAAYVRDGYGAFRQPKFKSGCCKVLVLRVCGVRRNLYVFSLYRNPDLDDRIFYCLLASMAAVQAEDVHASFLFVGDLNDNHQEWLGSTTANRHGVAAFDFTTVSSCDELVVGPTHSRPNQKFIVVATSRMIGIHRSSVDLRRRPPSAFQSFPILSNAGSTAFPMLAIVGNTRDSVL